MSYKAIIFDLDGTLIDSKLDFPKIREELGITVDTGLLEEIEKWPKEKQEWAHTILDKHELEGIRISELYPGVTEFLDLLRKNNIPCALFTRNSRRAATLAIEKHAFQFKVVISRDDAPPKPDPTGLFEIAKALNTEPHEILYIGDYLFDLKAGRAAGIKTALFLQCEADFDTEGAHFTFTQFLELHAHCTY